MSEKHRNSLGISGAPARGGVTMQGSHQQPSKCSAAALQLQAPSLLGRRSGLPQPPREPQCLVPQPLWCPTRSLQGFWCFFFVGESVMGH